MNICTMHMGQTYHSCVPVPTVLVIVRLPVSVSIASSQCTRKSFGVTTESPLFPRTKIYVRELYTIDGVYMVHKTMYML